MTQFINNLINEQKELFTKLVEHPKCADMFEYIMNTYYALNWKSVAKWILNYYNTEVNIFQKNKNTSWLNMYDNLQMSADNLAKLIWATDKGLIPRNVGKNIFHELFITGIDPLEYIYEHNLHLQDDTNILKDKIKKILIKFPKDISDYKNGNIKVIGFFVGQIRKNIKDINDPSIIQAVIKEVLKEI